MNRILSLSRRAAILTALLIVCGSAVVGQRPSAEPDSALNHHRFVFSAQWITDYKGGRRQLTPPYELMVTSDSIDGYLPYTGRMYTVPTPDELRFMGIRFSSKKFSYLARRSRRSGWDLIIKPVDAPGIAELYFRVSRGGWSTLSVRFSGRDPVSYEGVLGPIAP